MFPTEIIETSQIQSLVFYVAILGLLLFIGTIIRLKVTFFKKILIPASLIAGGIGIILGPFVLDILPQQMVDAWAGMPGILIAVVFAPMLIGMTINWKKVKETQTIEQVIYSWQASFLQ